MRNNVPPIEVEPTTFPGRLVKLTLTPAQNLRLVPHPGNTTPLPARLKILGLFLLSAYRYFEKSNQTETIVANSILSLRMLVTRK